MQEKLKHYTNKFLDFIEQLRDVRYAGMVLFAIIVLLISWSGVKVIQTNYELQRQIAALNQQNSVQQLKDDNLKLQTEYYNTDQYLELSARQNFGLGKPGEKELIVPREVALKHTVDLSTTAAAEQAAKQPFYKQNLQDWLHFFMHQQS